jgi:hypothetical protein
MGAKKAAKIMAAFVARYDLHWPLSKIEVSVTAAYR